MFRNTKNEVRFQKEENQNNHVLYRVTPIFENDNLVASGVQMEAYSVEDKGKGVCFNVYVYNVQPGIVRDYKTGESWLKEWNMVQNNRMRGVKFIEFKLVQ